MVKIVAIYVKILKSTNMKESSKEHMGKDQIIIEGAYDNPPHWEKRYIWETNILMLLSCGL